MKRIVLALAVVVSLLSGTAVYAQHSYDASVRPLWKGDDQICTANSINQKMGLWLTAFHCVRGGGEDFRIEDRSDPEHPFHAATVVVSDEAHDMVVLLTMGLRVPALRLAQVAPVVGEDVSMVGYPGGLRQPQFIRGYLSHPDTQIPNEGRYQMFGMPVCGGHSGSAIVNSEGELVSVVQVGPGTPCAPMTGGATFQALVNFTARFFADKD